MSAPQGPITLRYDLRLEDVVALADHISATSSLVRGGILRRRLILGAIVVALGVYMLARVGHPSAGFLAFAAVIILYLVFLPQVTRWRYRRYQTRLYSGASPSTLGPRELSVEDGQLVQRTPRSEARFHLDALGAVARSGPRTFIEVGPQAYIVIPQKRITAGDVDALLGRLKA